VQGRLGMKTEYSHRPLPLDPDLAKEILRWRDEGPYPDKGLQDFVFRNLNTEQAMWQDSILDRHIKPAAERAKLGVIGWYTFRHSYRAWLKRTGASMGVQQELMRHANLQTTLGTYGKEIEVSDQHRQGTARSCR